MAAKAKPKNAAPKAANTSTKMVTVNGHHKYHSVPRGYELKKIASHKKRRKRVSGFGGANIQKLLTNVAIAGAGNIVGRAVMLYIGKPKSSTDTDYRPFAAIGVGAGLAMFVKNDMAIAAGVGVASAGVSSFITDAQISQMLPSSTSTPTPTGKGSVTPGASSRVSGRPMVPAVSGRNERRQQRMLNGVRNKDPYVAGNYAVTSAVAG